MKLIRSFVRPDKLDEIKQALSGIHVRGLCVAETSDYAPQPHATTVWLGREYTHDCSAKLQIEVVVHDADVDEVVDAIIRAARTRREGDGDVMVLPVDHRYNISDGHRDVS